MPPRTPVPRSTLLSLRTSLVLLALVPSLAIVGFWAATTANVLSTGFNLRAENAVNAQVSRPFGDMIHAAAQERTLSAVWLADPGATHAALDAQRRLTDQAVAEMAAVPAALKGAPERTKAAYQPVADAINALDLTNLRARIDARSISTDTATAAFTRVINAEIVGTDEILQVDDVSLVIGSQPFGPMFAAREALEQENAIMAPAVASGRLTPEARVAFINQAAARRSLVASTIATLGQEYPAQQAELVQFVGSPSWKTMEAIENDVTAGPGGKHTALPASAQQWTAAMAVVEPGVQKVTVDPLLVGAARAQARADTLVRQGLIISGAGLLATLVVVLLSWRVARSLLRRMTGLRRATLDLERQLPHVVNRLNSGERVDVAAETADLAYGDDELGQVAQAFNSAQRTALNSAVSLADARYGFQKAIMSVARHSQNLVNRQLDLLDSLERRHQEPEVLEGLYELDSQASQMRRYQENLVIIGGAQPGRRWTEPVALIDVIRGAVSEVADYQRITVDGDERLFLAAHAVADVIHLLAELMDNAVGFSPPACPVSVRSASVGRGLAIEIEDRGLGMTPDELAEINARLSEPPQFDVLALADDIRLGLFVVSHLAARHGIAVALRPSPFGGVSAVVVVPNHLLHQDAPAQTPAIQERAPLAAVTGGVPAAQPAPTWSAFTPARPAVEAPDAPPVAGPRPIEPPTAPQPGSGTPPLPQRVPQASLAEELRHDPPPADALPDDSEPVPPAEVLSRSMSAFQRGTTQARGFGGSTRSPHAPAHPEDPR